MIRLAQVTRRFGAQVLFERLDWLLTRSARVGLVGPNGAGKTTLLRLLAGLDEPDGGEVERARDLRVGFLPQEVETVGGGTVLGTVLDGFPALRRLEAEIQGLAARLAAARADDAESRALAQAYGAARHRFETLGGDRAEARARAILSGLGVPGDRFGEPLAALSGGWRMRVALARLLLGEPDLLLLDEPTNHLDLEAIAWLEGFLETFAGALVVVSHDRTFLNRMVHSIAELAHGRLTTFPGSLDRYLEASRAREAQQEKAAREQQREIARVERFVERFRYKATKARQVQERLRGLRELDRVEAPSRSRAIRFGFPPAPRSGDEVVRVEGVHKAYGERVVYDGCTFRMRRGDRVALVGPNGSGKSTLLRILSGAVRPDAGEVELGENVHVAAFAQHQLEALDAGATVLEEIEREAEAGMRPRLRALLGRFLFSGDDVDKRVGSLSGGEKARLALAKLLIRPANLLLLDEPTNHLDLRSLEVLEQALAEYDGSLVVISHDRTFINRVATSIGEVGGGRVRLHPGGYDAFLERRAAAEAAAPTADRASAGRAAPPPADTPGRERERAQRRAEAEERNRRYRERRAFEERIGPVEDEIASLEARLAEIAALQADPALYRDAARAREIGRERAEVEARLAAAYERWELVAAEQPPPTG